MIKRKSGTIVNIASLAAKNFVKNNSIYVASKFALRGFANSLMLEVREHGIRMITVFPGSVNTELIASSPTAPLPEYMLQPGDVAHAVYAAVTVHPRAMISEIDIRPSNPKRA
ncbi:MAG: SDR family NAD(P)-dependent oxidoreductase [Calditrichaeota bacterium]|nr:MAG: SDR family NAD(P)-dependent oxidoreductase [Calditrichota bacterium]